MKLEEDSTTYFATQMTQEEFEIRSIGKKKIPYEFNKIKKGEKMKEKKDYKNSKREFFLFLEKMHPKTERLEEKEYEKFEKIANKMIGKEKLIDQFKLIVILEALHDAYWKEYEKVISNKKAILSQDVEVGRANILIGIREGLRKAIVLTEKQNIV